MSAHLHSGLSLTLLGVECGATRSVALCADGDLRLIKRLEFGPANLRLLNDSQLLRHFRAIGSRMPKPAALCIGMAGARGPADFRRIQSSAAKIWSGVPCHATNDLETALMAADDPGQSANVNVLVLSGTGSCCFGRATDGRTSKIGGWGHILGDKGSGFEIALRALKAVVYYYDRDGRWPSLGARILRALQLNAPDDLIGWVQSAAKPEVAALATEVFRAAGQQDRIAADILKGAAHSLAQDAAACAERLAKSAVSVRFILAGSNLTKQPLLSKQVRSELRRLWPKGAVATPEKESAWGAVLLARELASAQSRPGVRQSSGAVDQSTVESKRGTDSDRPHLRSLSPEERAGVRGKRASEKPRALAPSATPDWLSPQSLQNSPTEQRNPRSMRLDKMSISDAVQLMLREDLRIPSALLKERTRIEQGVRMIARALKSGGRLFYVGAGTSGRLGVLDASECPPTFQTDPEMVQGIIAGGQRALWEAVEGAEDDPEKGAEAVRFRNVGKKDVVVGIAASGRTPFVWGALAEAKRRGARTILLCFNPSLAIPSKQRPSLVIAPNVGPELLTGSTRLKSGAATKLILNIFTTLAMVQLGKVMENLMIDVKASNSKLRDRAVRIVQQLAGTDYQQARSALDKSAWQVRAAVTALKKLKRENVKS